MRPVAIIGLGLSARDFGWRGGDWELWGMATDPRALVAFSCLAQDTYPEPYDMIFEMHEAAFLPEHIENTIDQLSVQNLPCYMHKSIPELSMSLTYPKEEVEKHVFSHLPARDYYGSGGAYMLALAISQWRPAIGLWGFDMHDQDGYFHQRANMEYLIGFAHGRGIDVSVVESSALLKHQMPDGWKSARFGELKYPERYGVLSQVGTEDSQDGDHHIRRIEDGSCDLVGA